MAGEIGSTPRPANTGRLAAPPPKPAALPTTGGVKPAPGKDQNGTKTPTLTQPLGVNVDNVELPPSFIDKARTSRDTASDATAVAEGFGQALKASDKVGDTIGKTTKGLGAIGVVTSLKGVADAIAASPMEASLVATALAELGMNLADAAGDLEKIPGLANALKVLGGVGGIVTGVMQLVDEFKSMAENGMTASNVTGALAGVCNTVGGLAMVISPIFPPAAAVGSALMIAGAGLNLAKLAIDNWDTVTEYADKAEDFVAGAAQSVSHGVSDAADAIGSGLSKAWGWLTD